MKKTIGAALPAYILRSLVALCLSVVVLMGFVVSPDLQFNWLLNGMLCLILQAILGMRIVVKASPLTPGIIYGALALVAIIVGVATSSVPVLVDAEGNNLIYVMVMLLCNALTYVLTTTRRRCIAFWVLGILAIGYVQFVFHSDLYVVSFGFVLCGILLFMYLTYLQNATVTNDRADTASNMSASVLLTGLGALALSVLVGVCVYALIIAPLDPGRVSLKLFVMDQALETIEVNHPVRIEKVEDEEQHTEQVTEETISGNKSHPVQASSTSNALSSEFMEDSLNYMGSKDTYSLDANDDSDIDLVTFEWPSWWWLLIVVGIPLIILLAILVRIVVREMHKRSIKKQSPDQQVRLLYKELLAKMGKLGVGKPPTAAPVEFAEASAERTAAFSVPYKDSNWRAVTQAYDSVCFAGQAPSERQLADCWAFYDGFGDNARRRVGTWRYAFRYFWTLK